MALALTAAGLRRDAARVAGGVGIPAASAGAASIASHEVVRRMKGTRKVIVGGLLIGGGALVAAKATGRVLPYAGIGAALGSIWSFLGGQATDEPVRFFRW